MKENTLESCNNINKEIQSQEKKSSIKLRDKSNQMKTLATILSVMLAAPFAIFAVFSYVKFPKHPQTIIIIISVMPIVVLALFIYYYVSAKAESYNVLSDILQSINEINNKISVINIEDKEEENEIHESEK